LKKYEGIPWFVPEWLGGFGLPKDHDSEVEKDRVAATYIKVHMGKIGKLTPVVPKDMAFWLMHKEVLKDIKELHMVKKPFRNIFLSESQEIKSIEDEYSRFYKFATRNLLFTRTLDELTNVCKEDKSIHYALLKNQRIWQRAHLTDEKWHLEPMSDEDMALENKHMEIPCVVREMSQDFNSLLKTHEEWFPNGIRGTICYGEEIECR